MRRPIKNFDFISLNAREYCLKYFWPVLVLSAVGGACLGWILDDWFTARAVYQGWNTYLQGHSGIPGKAIVGFLSAMILCALVYSLLHRIMTRYLRQKKLAFIAVFKTVKKEAAMMEKKQRDYDANLLREYYLYAAAMRAARDSDEIITKQSGMAL